MIMKRRKRRRVASLIKWNSGSNPKSVTRDEAKIILKYYKSIHSYLYGTIWHMFMKSAKLTCCMLVSVFFKITYYCIPKAKAIFKGDFKSEASLQKPLKILAI